MTPLAAQRDLGPDQGGANERPSCPQRPRRVEKQQLAFAVVSDSDLATKPERYEGCYVQPPSRLEDCTTEYGPIQDSPAGDPSTPTIQHSTRVFPFPTARRTLESFGIVQRWEGTVTQVIGDEFLARLRDLTDTEHASEQATFSLDEVDDDDRQLLRVGAVFYWSIGYHHQANGSRRLSNELRFRRLPQWTAADLSKLDAPSELDTLFGNDA